MVRIKAGGKSIKNASVIFGWFALAFLLAVHGNYTFQFMGGADIWKSPLPILVHDHAYVAYNGKVAARALKDSWTTAAYDPHYMAGYVNSFISSSNGVLPFVVLAAGEENAGIAYKFYTLISVVGMPLMVFAAGRWFGWMRAQATLSAGLWVLSFWSSGKSWRYLDYGMVAFLTSSGWLLLTGAAVSRFFERPGLGIAVVVGTIAGIACLWHTTVAVLIGPACVAVAIVCGRHLTSRNWIQLLLAVLTCLLINLPWLATIPTVWGTLGTTPKFFVNPNVGERLRDILMLRDESVTIPLLFAIGGMVVARKILSTPAAVFMAASIAWLAFLAYPAGWFRPLDVLQPGRNTVGLTAWLCLPAGGLLSVLCSKKSWLIGTIALAASAVYLLSAFNGFWVNAQLVMDGPAHRMPSKLPGLYRQIATRIRSDFKGRRRIFYEDCNSGVAGAANPFYNFRPTPWMAELTGVEVIGGPYMRTHYNAGFVQVGDGKIMGRTAWSKADFDRWADAYDVSGIFCWSPPISNFCIGHTDRFRELFTWFERTSNSHVRGFALQPERKSRLPADVTVHAEINRITLNCVAKTATAIVLPYHWQPGLVASTGVAIRPRKLEGIDLPLIEVEPFEGEAFIRFDAWAGWRFSNK